MAISVAPSRLDQDTSSPQRAVITLRPIATPLSLGFAALAVASLTVSAVELQWIDPAANSNTVGLTVLTFAVPLQLISAIYGFLARDAVAATGLGILSGAWLAIGTTMYTSAPAATSGALGMFLLAVATVLTVPAFASLGGKLVAATVLLSVAARFYLTGAYELTASAAWRDAAGICGLVAAGLALYAAYAFEIEGVRRRTLLPTGRLGAAKTALDGDFGDEVAGAEHDPGVRQRL